MKSAVIMIRMIIRMVSGLIQQVYFEKQSYKTMMTKLYLKPAPIKDIFLNRDKVKISD